ncbi:GNAT family N-acetyltransferase [Aeromonas cavernicola]|uniref:N-acetyltransferase n=1 Tax=Aeromonas cavernicola TaxID=1006623 RepID=A0A2H9U6A3_9GAMM|nr:GNAT family N-acetyltransferase [Aeromonas cavernicola]PJG59532.1 N-acetyltransferase [Aeromonas cavernicola]
MQSISLRIARPTDAAAMTVIQRASWLAAYGETQGSARLAQLAAVEHLQVWQRRLAKTDPAPMLLCVDDVIKGLLYWQAMPEHEGAPSALIRAFYLHPSYWGQGYGRRLWQAVAMQMRMAGCGHATLWLLNGNPVGEHFCQQRGFVFAGQQRTSPILGADGFQRKMCCSL